MRPAFRRRPRWETRERRATPGTPRGARFPKRLLGGRQRRGRHVGRRRAGRGSRSRPAAEDGWHPGAKKGSFSRIFAAVTPARRAHEVAKREVPTMAVGFFRTLAATMAIAVVGSSWTELVLIAKNVHMALVAVPGCGIEFFQQRHRPQAEWRGGIAEAEHVRCDIHDHRPHGRVLRRHVGEQDAQDRPQSPREHRDQAGTLGEPHHPQPDRHSADQRQGDRPSLPSWRLQTRHR